MRTLLTISMIGAIAFGSACDPQSGISKKSVEKYNTPTPTPTSPTPEPTPIDPAEIANADVTQESKTLSVNETKGKPTVRCDKYNNVMVNGSDNIVTIKGVCRRIMFNGNGNDVNAEAATEIVFNGNENTIRYAKFANGKLPIITDNKGTNSADKAEAGGAKPAGE